MTRTCCTTPASAALETVVGSSERKSKNNKRRRRSRKANQMMKKGKAKRRKQLPPRHLHHYRDPHQQHGQELAWVPECSSHRRAKQVRSVVMTRPSFHPLLPKRNEAIPHFCSSCLTFSLCFCVVDNQVPPSGPEESALHSK